jgi:hypothetical protein
LHGHFFAAPALLKNRPKASNFEKMARFSARFCAQPIELAALAVTEKYFFGTSETSLGDFGAAPRFAIDFPGRMPCSPGRNSDSKA